MMLIYVKGKMPLQDIERQMLIVNKTTKLHHTLTHTNKAWLVFLSFDELTSQLGHQVPKYGSGLQIH